MLFFISMVYLWIFCFFSFIVMLYVFNCSVYFDNINFFCKVIFLVCLYFLFIDRYKLVNICVYRFFMYFSFRDNCIINFLK